MHHRPYLVLLSILLLLILIFSFDPSQHFTTQIDSHSRQTQKQTLREPIERQQIRSKSSKAEEPSPAAAENHFSPEMDRLVRGIKAGRSVVVRAGSKEQLYLFRGRSVTTDDFEISAGPTEVYPSSFEVFEGRRIMADGSLTGKATLAVVNDTVSMAYSDPDGDYLIERNEDGELVKRTLTSYEEGSTYGHFECMCPCCVMAQSQDGSPGMAGVSDMTGDSPQPPILSAAISLSGDEDEELFPTTEAALAEHNYYRLGPQYDASLKDIRILMVSGSTQTGPTSNLSSQSASYFTIAARVADVYERQLGLRYQLQEMVLIANDAGQPDIEYDDSVTPNNTSTGSDDLWAVKDWLNVYRPQGTYGWGHVQAWALANSDSGGTIGWAWTNSYGSSSHGMSVCEKSWHWAVVIHEVGHNLGASHSSGGAMSSSISRNNPQEDFFREDEATGAYTAATEIYNYMSNPGRSFVFGPAELRNPVEMPFGVDDTVATASDTPVSFNPLSNDLTATPLFGATNNLRLVEVGQVFPKAAGSASVSGNEITFTPVGGYTGRVWFSYTLAGDVGNDGRGWLHSADVVLTVGGNTSNPNQSPSISTTDDIVRTDFSGDIRLNPLLNDEGKGRLWVGGVDALSDFLSPGTAESYSDGAFHLVSAVVQVGNGSVTLETAVMTRDGVSTTDNTGYLVYTPGANEPSQVQIQYVVEDEDGNQSMGMIYLDDTETVSLSSNLNELVEREGRVATITIARTGSTAASEWVDLLVSGQVSLVGASSDAALAGFDSFDAATGTGRVSIPSGQASVSIKLSVMEDALVEGIESIDIRIMALESLLINGDENSVSIAVTEVSGIGNLVASEDFDSFTSGSTALGGGWTNDNSQTGTWRAQVGQTGSDFTGPENDHTQGDNSGRYLYREASGNSNQRADLLSPSFNLDAYSNLQIEFYYHMYGSDMGELRVDVFSGGVWNEDMMPALIGQQQNALDDPWKKMAIDVSAYATDDFRVRFRGTTGDSFRSDMAIDDFAVGELFSPAVAGPVIEAQPQSATLDPGDAAYLSVVAQAFPSPTYQWKKNGVDIPGATRSVLHFALTVASDSGNYTCELTSGGTVTTSVASLFVGDTVDSDMDGLPDSWESNFFGHLDQGSTDDPDGDGDDNLTEFNNGSDPTVAPGEFRLARGVLSNLGSNWRTVTLPESYTSMVVIANVVLTSSSDPVMITRIRNAAGNSFEIRVQNPAGATLTGATVHYMVMEEGFYTVANEGLKIEAVKFNSTVTDSDSSWVGQSRAYINNYTNPVVMGQVMSTNDPNWSSFWCYDGSNIGNPPSSSGFAIGKHVGGDSNTTRADETLVYIVLEQGDGTIDGVDFVAGLGADTVEGLDNTPPDNYAISLSGAEVAIVTLAAMDGTDGGHACLFGSKPVTDTTLSLTVDEDTLSDPERAHTTEQVGYLIFETEDSDADGIADGWEITQFDSILMSDGTLDGDDDGSADFFEYLFGSDPNDAGSDGFRLDIGRSNTGAALLFDWKVQPGQILGQHYNLMVSTDLNSWTVLPSNHFNLTETPNNGKSQLELEVTHDYGSKVFLRIEQP